MAKSIANNFFSKGENSYHDNSYTTLLTHEASKKGRNAFSWATKCGCELTTFHCYLSTVTIAPKPIRKLPIQMMRVPASRKLTDGYLTHKNPKTNKRKHDVSMNAKHGLRYATSNIKPKNKNSKNEHGITLIIEQAIRRKRERTGEWVMCPADKHVEAGGCVCLKPETLEERSRNREENRSTTRTWAPCSVNDDADHQSHN